MRAHWVLWVDSKTPKNAERLFNRFRKELGADTELHNVRIAAIETRPGHNIFFEVEIESKDWNDAVIESILIGERVGYGWGLTGSVADDAGADSKQLRVPGIEAASWLLQE